MKNISTKIFRIFDEDRVHFRFYDPSIDTFSMVIEEYRSDKNAPSAMERLIYHILLDLSFMSKTFLY